ncbi:hypothetical protein XELAEV_18000334mg [Xenopus laevis]|uniref:Uncharacterized protein n=1 Tax=Xenopus laevis TaxID=8355 RepID=A0A974BP66_XENLA|nr:hypothetical protein XELAEV_18000334mg [Xenopus laevis]
MSADTNSSSGLIITPAPNSTSLVTSMQPTSSIIFNSTNITMPHVCLIILFEDIGNSRYEPQSLKCICTAQMCRPLLAIH